MDWLHAPQEYGNNDVELTELQNMNKMAQQNNLMAKFAFA